MADSYMASATVRAKLDTYGSASTALHVVVGAAAAGSSLFWYRHRSPRQERIAAGAKSSLASDNPYNITAKAVAEAAKKVNPLAREVWDETVRYLAFGLNNIIVTLARRRSYWVEASRRLEPVIGAAPQTGIMRL